MLGFRNKYNTIKAAPEAYGQRTHGNKLQTAVNTYRNATGRTITVVGIEHIGEPDYYITLRKLVDEFELQGAQVRVELMHVGEGLVAARTDDERAALQAYLDDGTERFSTYKALGLPWIDQAESAMGDTSPTWVHSDVNAIDVIRLVGPQEMLSRPQSAGATQATRRIEDMKAKNQRLALRAARTVSATRMINRGKYVRRQEIPGGWWLQRVMNSWRECEEMRKVLAEDTDVVLVWGAVHMLGFNEVLTRNAFDLLDTEWFTAIDGDNKGSLST